MNKPFSWKTLLAIALVCFVLKFVVTGEAIGFALDVIGLLSLVSGITGLVKQHKSKAVQLGGMNQTKKIPTYNEMMKMSEVEFSKWVNLVFGDLAHQEKLLNEMIEYESIVKNLEKEKIRMKENRVKEDFKYDFDNLVDNLFNKDKEKSTKAIHFLDELKKLSGVDVLSKTLLAKVATDRAELGLVSSS